MLDEENDLSTVDDAETVDPQVLAEMERYVQRNHKREEIEPYPQEWMGDLERATFSRLSESLLGEQRSDHWLQNKVFKGFGADYLDFNKPLTPEEQQGVERTDDFPDFGIHALLFLQKNELFLNRLVRDMSEMQKFKSDPEQIEEGMISGIAYALNPPKMGNMDQRLNFFALFPKNLSFDVLNEYLDDINKARFMAMRIRQALDDAKFSLKTEEDLTDGERADGFRSVDLCRSKTHAVKGEFLAALATIADDTTEGAGDGLLSHLLRMIEKGGNRDLEEFVAFHISKRTLSARTKEGKRKEREVSIYYEGEEGDHTLHGKLSVREEVTENGVVRTSAANRHAFQRAETYEEKARTAEKAKEFTSASLEGTARLAEIVIQELRDEAIETFEAKDKNAETINDSDCLGLILPEALYYYIQAAIAQAEAIIHPENEATAEKMRQLGLRLVYKRGRSQVGFKQSGQRDLGSLVDLECLEQQLTPYRERKKQICELWREGKTPDVIAKASGCDLMFAEDTIRQIRLMEKPRQRKKGDKQSPEEFFDDLTAANIKNGFSWRWGRILTVLYAPLKDDPYNKQIEDEVREWCRRHKRPMIQDTEAFPMRFRRRLRRRYHLIDSAALGDLVSLLTVHSFIESGTIPKRSYPKEEADALMAIKDVGERYKAIKNKKGMQPGPAWGHNVCRATGESNIRMFYDIFRGGLQRDNPTHQEVRRRAAVVIKMRRAKASKKNGRRSAATEHAASVDSSDMQQV